MYYYKPVETNQILIIIKYFVQLYQYYIYYIIILLYYRKMCKHFNKNVY